MTYAQRAAYYYIGAFILCVLVGALIGGAWGYEGPTVTAEAVICDEADQVRAFIKEIEAGADVAEAFKSVETDDTSCAMGFYALVPGEPDGKPIITRSGVIQVLNVKVVAVALDNGAWMTVDPPVEVYTAHIVEPGQGV